MGTVGRKMEFFKPILASAIFFQLALAAPSVETQKSLCPKFWVDASSVGLGCLLYNSSTAYDHEHATTYCNTEDNAILVMIMTQEQKEFITMELFLIENQSGSKKTWWTSATDLAREGQWYYPSTFEDVPELVWHQGQPNQGTSANCMVLKWSLGYDGDDEPCSSSTYYPICQKMIE